MLIQTLLNWYLLVSGFEVYDQGALAPVARVGREAAAAPLPPCHVPLTRLSLLIRRRAEKGPSELTASLSAGLVEHANVRSLFFLTRDAGHALLKREATLFRPEVFFPDLILISLLFYPGKRGQDHLQAGVCELGHFNLPAHRAWRQALFAADGARAPTSLLCARHNK